MTDQPLKITCAQIDAISASAVISASFLCPLEDPFSAEYIPSSNLGEATADLVLRLTHKMLCKFCSAHAQLILELSSVNEYF